MENLYWKKQIQKYSIILIIVFSLLSSGCKLSLRQDSQKAQILKQNKISIQVQDDKLEDNTISLKRPYPTAKGNSAEQTQNIRIGLIVCESGPLSPWGNEIKKATQLAVELFNKTQNIKGKKIELIIADSASKAEQGKSAAEKLITQGVIGIIGDLTSGITIQIAKACFEKGIPQISIGATKDNITDIGANLFRICYTDEFQGKVMAKFAYEELNLRKIGLFTDKKEPYSVGLTEGFKSFFKKLGGKVVDQQFYESGQSDFSAQLTNMKSKNPDGIFVGGYYPEVGPIARQINAAEIDLYKLGGDGWDSSELLTSGGKAILGGYYCNHYDLSEKRTIVQQFLQRWKTQYQFLPKTVVAPLAYDSINVMIKALHKCKSLNSIELIHAIDKVENFNGVTGIISFKGMQGNPKKRAVVIELTPHGKRVRKVYHFNQLINKT